jgi:phosphoglycolate phosphatase
MSLSLILFDFDGTIADTFSETVLIYNYFARKYRYNEISDEDIEKARHMNMWQLLKFVKVPKHKVPFLLRKGRKMLYKNLDKIEVFPGIRELLKLAEERGIPCGIITSNSRKNVERFIQINDLPNIHFVRSSSRLLGKPREFKKVMKKRKLTKDCVIYVGDETRDIEAAQAADIEVVAVAWGYNSTKSLIAHRPSHFVKTQDELLALFEEKIATKSRPAATADF